MRVSTVILSARALGEAIGFAAIAALLHAFTLGREPLGLAAGVAGLFGVTLVLVAMLRERGTTTQSAGLVVLVVVAAASWLLSLPARDPDALAVLTRAIGAGLAGIAYLWRLLSIARGLQRWREVRDGALFAVFGIAAAALIPVPVDRGALPWLALVLISVSGIALSLARSQEELALASGTVRGRPGGGAATGASFVLGALAIGLALLLPSLQELLAAIAATLGPLLGEALFFLLLPLGYVAAYLVYAVQWVMATFGVTQLRPPRLPQRSDADDLERLREIEEMRPLVFGAVEVLIGLVGVLFALILVLRLVQERRALIPEGVLVEREAAEGISLRETLAGLLPRRRRSRRPPRDDGSSAAALRALYWRLLELVDRRGLGWRAPAETPREHGARIAEAAALWRDAAPIVRAFEELRYGEREPSAQTVDAARSILADLERSSARSA